MEDRREVFLGLLSPVSNLWKVVDEGQLTMAQALFFKRVSVVRWFCRGAVLGNRMVEDESGRTA